LQQAAYLYGVRFGAETQYCLIDIDAGSAYHPGKDPQALSRLLEALEAIDLTAPIICTSSETGGLHLYIPLSHVVNSWKVAVALSTTLSHAGFNLRGGQLEIFPNPKSYSPETPSLFHAHRLPLQPGSYLLNQDLQPTQGGRSRFTRLWRSAQIQNQLTPKKLEQILKRSVRQPYRISTKAAKFLNDLNAEIELGWTDYGQTNRLLGRIALRTYVFHHVLSGGAPLEGQALTDEIVAIAQALPGYRDWCRHQHELDKRAAEWARCVETSRYFRYGGSKQSLVEPTVSISITNRWNVQQLQHTRHRIATIVEQLKHLGQLPKGITERFRTLVQQGIGGSSLYRHKDLWHPNLIQDFDTTSWANSTDSISHPSQDALPETLGFEPAHHTNWSDDCLGKASSDHNSTSLFLPIGSNPLQSQDLSDRPLQDYDHRGRNTNHPPGENLDQMADHDRLMTKSEPASDPLGVHYVQQVLQWVKDQARHWKQASQRVVTCDRSHQYERYDQDQWARMQQFLDSGDAILMAEATQWFLQQKPESPIKSGPIKSWLDTELNPGATPPPVD
ncbi:MAG TPA: hypothetical protein V6D20_18100, partial [Candidatus Obscuribacterales bacterium]